MLAEDPPETVSRHNARRLKILFKTETLPDVMINLSDVLVKGHEFFYQSYLASCAVISYIFYTFFLHTLKKLHLLHLILILMV